jgi:2-desacetyl-2-hydroxyethyl bacteriochlorophyllide A dehydrogenase
MGGAVTLKTVRFLSPGVVNVEESALPEPGEGEVLVGSICSAISAGTELLAYRNQLPSEMAMDATFPALSSTPSYPLSFGYAAVGEVLAAGTGVDASWGGRRVFAFHPHASHFVAATTELTPLPESCSPEAAALLPSMETALNLLHDGRPLIGERIAVLGQGVVGLLTTALLSRLRPSPLITVDAHPLRRRTSLTFGASVSLDPADSDSLQPWRVATQNTRGASGLDLCYELSGSPEALDLALELTGYSGRIVIGSWYGTKRGEVNLGGPFHRSRIRILSSQVSTIDPALSGRWDKDRRLALALELIEQFQPEALITHRIPVEQAAQAYRLLDQEPERALQVLITYE